MKLHHMLFSSLDTCGVHGEFALISEVFPELFD